MEEILIKSANIAKLGTTANAPEDKGKKNNLDSSQNSLNPAQRNLIEINANFFKVQKKNQMNK